jgi:hypothetical protein
MPKAERERFNKSFVFRKEGDIIQAKLRTDRGTGGHSRAKVVVFSQCSRAVTVTFAFDVSIAPRAKSS